MTVLNPPMMIAGRTDHNADDFRGALAASMVGQGSGLLLPRAGILPGWGAELSVAQAGTPAMSVVVGTGKAFIPAPTNGHGGWYVINDGALTLSIAASNATNPRIDLVIARVADPQYYAGGDGLGSIKVITGVAAASPLVPTVPTSEGAFVVLAQIAVAANATTIVNANITLNTNTSRAYTVGLGGVLPIANVAARPTTPYQGQYVHENDTNKLRVRGSTTWAVPDLTDVANNTVQLLGGLAAASNYFSRITYLSPKFVHVDFRIDAAAAAASQRIYFTGLPTPYPRPVDNSVYRPASATAKVNGGAGGIYGLTYRAVDSLWFLAGGDAVSIVTSAIAIGDYFIGSLTYEIQ